MARSTGGLGSPPLTGWGTAGSGRAVEGKDDPLSLDISILDTFYTLICIDFILNSEYILFTNLNRFYPQLLIYSIH